MTGSAWKKQADPANVPKEKRGMEMKNDKDGVL